ncbi:MAG TPA: purine-nucleoside phosphorylase, partial [bacterium]|nr:purine-nucleoside phosphorylase [bacterium]
MSSLTDRLNEAHTWLVERIKITPEVSLVLGSGLGSFIDQLDPEKTIPYQQIPHFPEVTVEGHEGKLAFGYWHDIPLIIACGRHHLYEGYSL